MTFDQNPEERGASYENESKEKRENEQNINHLLSRLSNTLKREISFSSQGSPMIMVMAYGGKHTPFTAALSFRNSGENLNVSGEYEHEPQKLKNLVFTNADKTKTYKVDIFTPASD